MPNHRKLYLQVLKDPAQPYVLARLTEPRDRFALSKCDDVSIVESASLTKLAIRTHGNHYLTGRLPVRGAEVLAGIVDSNISVCGEQWLLEQESREQVQVFLKARRQLIDAAVMTPRRLSQYSSSLPRRLKHLPSRRTPLRPRRTPLRPRRTPRRPRRTPPRPLRSVRTPRPSRPRNESCDVGGCLVMI